jgi:hypothetical protein
VKKRKPDPPPIAMESIIVGDRFFARTHEQSDAEGEPIVLTVVEIFHAHRESRLDSMLLRCSDDRFNNYCSRYRELTREALARCAIGRVE